MASSEFGQKMNDCSKERELLAIGCLKGDASANIEENITDNIVFSLQTESRNCSNIPVSGYYSQESA